MTAQLQEKPASWAARIVGGAEAPAAGTEGAPSGTSGALSRVVLLVAFLVVAAAMALDATVNVFTKLDDAARMGRPLDPAAVATWEISSAIAGLIATPIVYGALRLAPLSLAPLRPRRLLATAAVHLVASLSFSVVHVGLMVAMRMAVYAAAGHHYRFGLGEWPYEYRKDFISYLTLLSLFWTAGRLAALAPQPRPAARTGETATFDIRDGAAIIRAPVREILAARAAGNYVEFALEDGRRPLMRASMASIEAELAPLGFLRTHRSWLVNAERVRAIR